MTIVITGGSGFIGTNLVEFLLKKNHKVINYDIVEPRNISHLKYWINLDILDKQKLSFQLNLDNPDFIIHLAARTDLNEKINISGYDVNITGVQNLMDVSITIKNLNRIIIASSMLVCKTGYIPNTFDDYQPNNLYGESKVLSEKIVKSFGNNWVIIRPTSIWGPWFREPYFNFFRLVIKGFYFNIPKTKASIKTYGYVENACLQIYSIMIAESEMVVHRYFYLGDKMPINITDWADLIRNLLKKRKLLTLPLLFLKFGSYLGDFLHFFLNIKNFPLNSFRYSNMTTNNIIEDVDRTNKLLNEDSLITHEFGVKITLDWISKQAGKN
jgi:nucleoside-diphosphate-sugar epimerase